MPSTFITDADLKQYLADTLKVDMGTMPTAWGRIVTAANSAAFLDIRGGLIRRGYRAADILNWDRGAEFNRDIGLYWCLVRGAGLHGYDDRFIKCFDRRKELTEVLVELGGDPQPPTFDPSGVEHGDVETDNDRWSMDDVL